MTRGASSAQLVDGRRARTERGRAAVIDAVFELLMDGHIPPPVDAVAERSGVSVSTVFRYFEGLDELQRHAFERFRERFGPLFEIDDAGSGTRPHRIARFADARLDLYRHAGPLMLVARLRVLESVAFADAVATMRSMLASQVPAQFAAELGELTPARRANLVAFVDSATSPEAWDISVRLHARSPRQVRTAWIEALTNVLDTGSLDTGSLDTGPNPTRSRDT